MPVMIADVGVDALCLVDLVGAKEVGR